MHVDIYPRKYKKWPYGNTVLLLISFVIVWWLVQLQHVQDVITYIAELGYLGAFIMGLLSVSLFTIAPAMVLLFALANILNPWEVAFFAGLGSMVSDYVVFRFLRDRIFDELRPIFQKIGRTQIGELFETPYFSWMLPVIGAAIIISPLPDEAGIGLLGASRIRSWQFLLLSFVLNAIGMFTVAFLARTT